MRPNRLLTWRRAMLAASLLGAPGCVQQAYDRVVVYRVDVSAIPGVQSVGLRGRSEPLSWEKDLPMRAVADSSGVYEATVTHHTGSLTTEVKFTVNGTYELDGGENRTVRMGRARANNDTTLYRGVFNVR